MQDKKKKNLLRTGIFATFILALLGTYIFMLGSRKAVFESKFILKAHVKNSESLKAGAMVLLKGMNVGSVRSIDFLSLDEIEIIFTVKDSFKPWIKKDSTVALKTQGLLGDTYMEISGGTETSASAENNDLIANETTLGIKDVLSKGENIMVVLNRVLEKTDHLLTQMTANNSIQKSFAEIASFSQNLNKMGQEMNTATKSLNKVISRIEEGPGTLHALIYDESVYEDLKIILGGAERNQMLKYFVRESIKKAKD
ncbi:MAG: MCE family protein [Bacteriovoracaceae bacterium]|nr:MCE family protein [Bacteriovoracaceae bacterium]